VTKGKTLALKAIDEVSIAGRQASDRAEKNFGDKRIRWLRGSCARGKGFVRFSDSVDQLMNFGDEPNVRCLSAKV
jgi:hypothetical protein